MNLFSEDSIRKKALLAIAQQMVIAARTEPENFNKISGQLQYIMRSVKWN